MRARLVLAVIVLPAFTLPAQQQSGTAPSGTRASARAGSARHAQAAARPRSIDDKRFHITPANRSAVPILERLRSAVFLGVLDTEAGAAGDASLLSGGYSPYPMPGGVARALDADPGEKVYVARRMIEKPKASPAWQPTLAARSDSGCWWLWVFTGVPFCS